MDFLFEQTNYQLIKAETVTEALIRADQDRPDLIILDILMPMDEKNPSELDPQGGIKVCRELKSNSETQMIPIIILSVKGDSRSFQAAKEAKADKYITKPFNTMELLKEVAGLLNEWKGNKEKADGR